MSKLMMDHEVFTSSIRHQFKTALPLWMPERKDLVSTADMVFVGFLMFRIVGLVLLCIFFVYLNNLNPCSFEKKALFIRF